MKTYRIVRDHGRPGQPICAYPAFHKPRWAAWEELYPSIEAATPRNALDKFHLFPELRRMSIGETT